MNSNILLSNLKSSFLQNGDFSFPLESGFFLQKNLYIWSFQNGAINLDGVLRFFVKLPTVLFFELTNNSVLTGYFYILSIFILSFFSFYVFLKYFKFVDSKYIAIVLSFLYIFNPIYLSNLSKIGLSLGVSLLLLIIIFLDKYFKERTKNSWFIFSFLLSCSLIHPFIFIVNMFTALVYSIYCLKEYRYKIELKEILLLFFITTLMFAFIVSAVVSTGTVSKTDIISDIGVNRNDVEGVFYVASTANIMNSFAWYKPVLKDYEYFHPEYKYQYFSFMYFINIVLLIMYVKHCKKIKRKDLFLVSVFLFIVCVLILFTTGVSLGVNFFLDWINSLPGGWAFRSPLKWQLYLPLVFLLVFAVLLKYSKNKFILVASIFLGFISSSHFMTIDIYSKLLKPKEMTNLSWLNELDFENQRFLFNTSNCSAEVNIQVQQITLSKNMQTKRITHNLYSEFLTRDYDYVGKCKRDSQKNFDLIGSSDGQFYLYENKSKSKFFFTFSRLNFLGVNLTKKDEINFLEEVEHKKQFFISGIDMESSWYSVQSLFGAEDKVTQLIRNSRIINSFYTNPLFNYKLFSKIGSVNLILDKNWKIGSKDSGFIYFNMITGLGTTTNIQYQNNTIDFKNIIPNPSFEDGMWQKEVQDCYNYDKDPLIKMSLNNTEKTDSNFSLQLEATRHTACTNTKFEVKPGKKYLLTFDYQSPNNSKSNFQLQFIGNDKTYFKDYLYYDNTDWQKYKKFIYTPTSTNMMALYLYAASPDRRTNIINRYDNFSLVEIPDLSDAYYLVSEPKEKLVEPREIGFEIVNPTKKLVHIKGATTSFFLGMSESYHPQWQAQFNNEKVNGFWNSWVPFVKPDRIEDEYHYKLNDFLNAWFIDVPKYCGANLPSTNLVEGLISAAPNQVGSCVLNSDGTYDIEMVVEFFPQRWFYLGLLISGTTFLGCLGYLGYVGVQAVRIKIKKRYETKN